MLMETALCKMEVLEPIYPLEIVRAMRDQRGMLVQTPVSGKTLWHSTVCNGGWNESHLACLKCALLSLLFSVPGIRLAHCVMSFGLCFAFHVIFVTQIYTVHMLYTWIEYTRYLGGIDLHNRCWREGSLSYILCSRPPADLFH